MDAANPIVDKITDFLQRIGIAYAIRPIAGDTFMPGVGLHGGVIIIDPERLIHPGDILHEAGHIAILPPDVRNKCDGSLDNELANQGDEMMAQAWSYAACVEIGLDPQVVFHEDGYRGNSESLIDIYSSDHPVAVCTLQWLGMTYEKKNAEKLNTLAYPGMVNWVRQA